MATTRVGASSGFEGVVALADGSLSARSLGRVAALDGGIGTPIAPLLRALRVSLIAAGKKLAGQGDIAFHLSNGRGAVRVSRLVLSSASGARAIVSGGSGIAYGWPSGGLRLDTGLSISGGGLPDVRIALAQTRAAAPIRGTVTMAAYAAGDARLTATPIVFTRGPDGLTRIATTVTLSGPLGDGRVENLSLPVDARWDGRGALSIDGGCAPLSWRRLSVSGLSLDAARIELCPTAGAMMRVAYGVIAGGVRVGAARLAGRLGQTPLTLAARGATVSLGGHGSALSGTMTGVEARIGPPERVTRLDVGRITGRARRCDGGRQLFRRGGASSPTFHCYSPMRRASGC